MLLFSLNFFLYLSDHRSKVRIYNSHSCPFRLCRDVSQSTILKPVFFSLLVSDLPASLPSTVKDSFYADDLAIWAYSPNVEWATAAVQTALNKMVEWSSKWHLTLNPLKCESFFFSLNPYQYISNPFYQFSNTPLNFSPNPTFLGVTFN